MWDAARKLVLCVGSRHKKFEENLASSNENSDSLDNFNRVNGNYARNLPARETLQELKKL